MNVHRGYVAVSFGQMHYRYAGTVGKPVIVLLHQTPSSSEMYEPLMRRLAADFRLIAPDTPGMGMSDPVAGELTIASLADGIAEFLDELGIDRCFLFGHHTGASIAAEIVCRHPVLATVVAMSGPPLLDDRMKAALPKNATAIAALPNGAHLLQMWQRMAAKDEDVPLSIIERETTNGLQLGERYPAAYAAVVAQDFASATASIACPTLVFAGSEDPLFGALDDMLVLLSNGRKKVIDGARTFVCETHCEQVATLLQDFFLAEAAS